jgi:uracil-DNA glycosylase
MLEHFIIENDWKTLLNEEMGKPYFQNLVTFLQQEKQKHYVYPPSNLVFAAFQHCSFKEVKVVILGQDPYHGQGQANGLSFSVNDGVPFPPSLRNIFKELKSNLGVEIPFSGNLEHWAKQGVLLLNATLTVRANSAGSHQKKGWEEFTDAVIKHIAEQKEQVVFILWGAYAQKKGAFIDRNKHLVLESAHPSPLSAHNGFLGNKHFSQTNAYLEKNGIKKIDF